MPVSFAFSLVYGRVLGAVPIQLFPAASHLLYLIPIRDLFRLCLGDLLIHFACPLQMLCFRCSSFPFCNLELSLISWAHMNSDVYFSGNPGLEQRPEPHPCPHGPILAQNKPP